MLPTKKSTIKSHDIKHILVYTMHGRFVLRYYERNRSFHSVIFEVNLIKYLKKRKNPCPDVLRNKRGKFAAYKNRMSKCNP